MDTYPLGGVVRKTDMLNRLKAPLLALALAAMPYAAHPAGLGRLAVASALGQPLRAEIDLTASREELSSLAARLASAEAFRNAGIEYSPALSGVRFSLEKRPNGQPYLVVASDRSFNEPFVDMLVEVTWSAGRLVREYTFLLDPPDVFSKQAPVAPVAIPAVKQPAAPVAEPRAPEAPRVAPPLQTIAAPPPPSVEPVGRVAKQPTEVGATRVVKPGDTLGKIASEIKPDGVNLDQMLVALYRSNKDVFDSSNMNRLRAGKILNISGIDAAADIAPGEAHQIVLAQAADFNAYRQRLAALAAAGPAKPEAAKQAAAGKIAPKVEDKTPAAAPEGKDKLEVSRAASGKDGKLGARLAAAEEDLVAREKALNEANSRVAQLEKNIADLKKLAELKAAAGAKPQEPAAPVKPAEPAQPVIAVPVQPVEAPKPPEAAPIPKPAVVKPVLPPSQPPPPAPSFVEENAELVFGGGAIVALLLGYLGYGAWRRRRQAAEASRDNLADAEFSSNSVFGSTGGQSVDTGGALPTDFSQAGAVGSAGDEGVDPVAEADVYMAYGRDSQAEEILLEALKSDPTRRAIHLKLLEIYAARKSLQPFATVARDLHGLTGGNGPDWEKAAALGRSIDPTNELYGGVKPSSGPDLSATVIMQAAAQAATAEEPVVVSAPPPVAPPADDASGSLDFDLDLGTEPEVPARAVEAQPAPDEVLSLDFDLDLGSETAEETPATPVVEAAAEPESGGLDFDLGSPAVEFAVPQPEAPAEPQPGGGDEVAALDFDFDIGVPSVAAPAEATAPLVDLSAISLELDVPAVAAEPALPNFDTVAARVEPTISELQLPMAEAEAPAEIEDDPEVATKLELAQAYEEMGDKEGARELLNEVLNEGSPAQQQSARTKLAQLA